MLLLRTCVDYIRLLPLGAFGALGLLAMLYLLYHDPVRAKLTSTAQLVDATLVGYISAIFSARLFFFFAEPDQALTLWNFFNITNGGFSIVGGVLGVFTIVPIYLAWQKIPILAALDLTALYAPLMQSIGRIGCLSVGCCYGMPTSKWLSVTYHNHSAGAPLGTALLPTQLYSSISLIMIFALLFFLRKQLKIGTGSILFLYLTLISIERWANDFFRSSHTHKFMLYDHNMYQIVALVTAAVSFILLCIVTLQSRGTHKRL